MSSVSLSTCPQCNADLDAARVSQTNLGADLRFCPQCNFPVMLIAGKYVLESVLGRGGFGTVYLARHVKLHRESERVIKIISPEIFEIPGMHDRFEREVQLTSLLSQRDDHIVRIYDDFGQIEGLGHFYVMEYLQGKSLDAFFPPEDELPSLDFCFHIFRQLCHAMANAHKEGVLHRDLKPENLFVLPRKQEPHFLKILDFGIARPINNEDLNKTGLTQGALGTPFYMSPEQCLNEVVDERTDLYSLGVILYKMLTGVTPFQGDGVQQSNSVVHVLMRMMQDPARPAQQLRPDRVTDALDQFVLKSLEKRPGDRFQSAEEMLAAFDRAVAGEAIPEESQDEFANTLPSAEVSPFVGNAAAPPVRISTWDRDVSVLPPSTPRAQKAPPFHEDRHTQKRSKKQEPRAGSGSGLKIVAVLLLLLSCAIGGAFALGYDKLLLSMIGQDEPSSTDAGVAKKPPKSTTQGKPRGVDAGTKIPPELRKKPFVRSKVKQRGPDSGKQDAAQTGTGNRKTPPLVRRDPKIPPQVVVCPPENKVRCSRGWAPKRTSYAFKGKRCHRWRCYKKKLTCPSSVRTRCRPGFVSKQESYRFRRLRCKRWVCRRLHLRRCPSLRPMHCGHGETRIKEFYSYRGRRCVRWGCKRRVGPACPASRKIYCLGARPVRKSYYYFGRRCYKWVCDY